MQVNYDERKYEIKFKNFEKKNEIIIWLDKKKKNSK